ncbi:LLM class flavin-dependent oxidoreductase [Streptosporangium lutulentum]
MTRVARGAEELGYHEVWTFQRLLYPQGHSMGPVYRSVHDPVVTLAYLAGVTSRVRLGVAVLNMPFASPALLAKQLTSLQTVSGGRLDVGLGLGWMPEEFTASGVPIERRGRRGEEFIRLLRRLWSEETVEHKGEFYELPPVHQDPSRRSHRRSCWAAARRWRCGAWGGWRTAGSVRAARILIVSMKNLHCKGSGPERRARPRGVALRHPGRHPGPPAGDPRPRPDDRLVRGDPGGRRQA